MKAVFNALQMGHRPERYLSKGKMVHYPERPERVRRLLQGLRKADAVIHASKTFDEKSYGLVHAPRYLDFLKNGYEEWAKLDGSYKEMMPSVRPTPGLSNYADHIVGKAGWHLSDFSCPMVADTWGVVKASADTALSAAQLVAGGEKTVYGLCRPPGHHAQQERAGGFCYLNNAALVAEELRKNFDKVAILDIDVHHGNGTQQIFYRRADVLTVSIHSDPDQYYPFFNGHSVERGADEGEGFNLNIPVPVKSGDTVWMEALENALVAIDNFAPNGLVISLGLDAHEADPLEGGAVTTQGFADMAGMIAETNLPTVIVQEGGYLTPYLGDNLASFLTGYESNLA
ncbi:Amino deacylase [hydrothermal vent metagenome]|uniref:Amino deacylase n=1 Tax=hydrothermal vent metagenome TaxID=652676 RepID=A0A3B0QZD4_9ZZZZ